MAQFGNRLIYSTAAAASADETVRSGIRLREREKRRKRRALGSFGVERKGHTVHIHTQAKAHTMTLCSALDRNRTYCKVIITKLEEEEEEKRLIGASE